MAQDEILLVDDQPEVGEYLAGLLGKHGYAVRGARHGREALALLGDSPDRYGLVLLDLDLGPGRRDGLEVLRQLRERHPDLPVIILSGKGTMETAVQAMKLGASEFLTKDLYIEETLASSVERVRALVRVLEENKRLKQRSRGLDYYRRLERERYRIAWKSEAVGRVLEEVQRLASIPRPILILGERGVGKELVAAAAHFSGSRAAGPFVTVNCAVFHGDLLESEIFGHERGAFTGAVERKIGRFELADEGTLFLDEIGNMSLDFQQKILRVIEYQAFERVAGTETIRVDVRVIAATNADLLERIAQGRFRPDLYDRLAFATVRVPPLRERPEDVPVLVEHFQERLVAEIPALAPCVWSPEALALLQRYPWPGNARQLKHVVEHLVVARAGQTLLPEHLPRELVHDRPAPTGFQERVEALQRQLLVEALEQARDQQKRAAELLGLSYDQFRHYYKKFGLGRKS